MNMAPYKYLHIVFFFNSFSAVDILFEGERKKFKQKYRTFSYREH